MIEFITNFFHSIFQDNVVLATIIIAMLPIFELKGAIPFAMSQILWDEAALSPFMALLFSFIGSIIVVPILALVVRPIYKHLKEKKFFKSVGEFLLGGVKRKSQKVNDQIANTETKNQLGFKMLSVMFFIAFPVPLTGVWTGTCLAIFVGLNFWQMFVSIFVGNAICGIIVAFICSISPLVSNIMICVFLALVVVMVIYRLIMHIIYKRKSEVKEDEIK